MKIYIPEDIAQAGKDYLVKRGYEIKPGSSLKEEIMAREVADCQGILVRTAPITEKIMKKGFVRGISFRTNRRGRLRRAGTGAA